MLGEEVVPVLRKEFAALQARARAGRADPRLAWSRPRRRRHRDAAADAEGRRDDHPHARRRHRRAEHAVVHPAARRPARRGDRRRRWRAAASTPTVEVVELREHAHDLADNLLTGFPTRALQAGASTRSPAPTALIAVTPIFTASYSGLFKTFFDVLDKDALAGKPVLIGATGGTARHSLALEHALRPLFAYLRAVVVPDRGVRRVRGLGRRRRRPSRRAGRADRAGRRRAGRPGRRPAAGGRRPTRSPTPRPFEELLRRD